MDFKEATDQLTACVRLVQLADELGVAENSVARARMDPASPNSRTPPPDWESAIAKLARARAAELLELAEELEDAGE